MLELASAKMPNAHLYQGDFSKGLVEPLQKQRYDFVVATYSLHHLTEEQKIELLTSLRERLKDNGKILIGDVAFETRDELNKCRQEVGDEWDDEEIYFVVEETKKRFPHVTFTKISHCAGVLMLSR